MKMPELNSFARSSLIWKERSKGWKIVGLPLVLASKKCSVAHFRLVLARQSFRRLKNISAQVVTAAFTSEAQSIEVQT